MDPVLIVVRNGDEDLGKYLEEFREMWVCGLARDGLNIFERFGKEGVYVVGQNCVHKERGVLARRQVMLYI